MSDGHGGVTIALLLNLLHKFAKVCLARLDVRLRDELGNSTDSLHCTCLIQVEMVNFRVKATKDWPSIPISFLTLYSKQIVPEKDNGASLVLLHCLVNIAGAATHRLHKFELLWFNSAFRLRYQFVGNESQVLYVNDGA